MVCCGSSIVGAEVSSADLRRRVTSRSVRFADITVLYAVNTAMTPYTTHRRNCCQKGCEIVQIINYQQIVHPITNN